jgi:general secretion pathway protein G
MESVRASSGFTLIELMLVLGILTILAAIAIPTFRVYAERTETTEAIEGIRSLEKELELFRMEWKAYPSDLSALGLDDLADPWGNPYQFLNLSDGGTGSAGRARKDKFLVPINSTFDLYSMGPDGVSVPPLTANQSRDDIIRANDGGYVGVAADY